MFQSLTLQDMSVVNLSYPPSPSPPTKSSLKHALYQTLLKLYLWDDR